MATSTEKSKRVSRINTWKPKEYQVIVEKDGKLFVCHFDRIFGYGNKLNAYNRFLIGKESYINQLDVITAYTNFFINNYDFDNELVTAYLKCKFALDKQRLFTEQDMNSYIDFIYEVMFTPTMTDKIVRMVEENYLDDIESTDDETKKYIKNDKKHLESLEFTNQHIKILLEISFSMKIMSPVLFHYIQINGIKIEKDSDIIFRFYQRLFKLYGYAETWEICDSTGTVLEDGISDTDAYKFIDDKWIEPTIIGSDRFYYFVTEEGEQRYLTRTQINIYNKLYVYVNFIVLAQTKINLFNCWKLLLFY